MLILVTQTGNPLQFPDGPGRQEGNATQPSGPEDGGPVLQLALQALDFRIDSGLAGQEGVSLASVSGPRRPNDFLEVLEYGRRIRYSTSPRPSNFIEPP